MIGYVCGGSVEVFAVVSVAHLNQPAQDTAHGGVIQTEFQSVAPLKVVKSVHIGLIHLLLIRARHADQSLVIIHIHQRLSARNLYHKSVGRRLISLFVQNGQLLRLHIHNGGKLVEQKISLITQLVCPAACQLNGINLLIDRSQILRDGIDLIRANLNLVVYVRLQISAFTSVLLPFFVISCKAALILLKSVLKPVLLSSFKYSSIILQ